MDLKQAIIKSKGVTAKPGYNFYIASEIAAEGYPGVAYKYVFCISIDLKKRNWWQKFWGIETKQIAKSENLDDLKEYIIWKK